MTAAPLSLTGPANLIAAVPYLLGFEPADSLVLVGLQNGRVIVSARIDLDDLDRPNAVVNGCSYVTSHVRQSLMVPRPCLLHGPTSRRSSKHYEGLRRC